MNGREEKSEWRGCKQEGRRRGGRREVNAVEEKVRDKETPAHPPHCKQDKKICQLTHHVVLSKSKKLLVAMPSSEMARETCLCCSDSCT